MKNKKNFSRQCLLILAACIAIVIQLSAQDTSAATNKWHYLLEPYVMFPNMSGTIGIGNLPNTEINENPGDIFSNLQMGAMLYAEAHNNTWAISSDLLYMKLGSDIEGKRDILSGNAEAKQLGWELDALRKLNSWLEAGIGAQLNSIKSELNLTLQDSTGGINKNGSLSETWVDPEIIARVKLPLSEKWSLQFRGNIGGFGIGSKFAWQLQGYAGYRFSKLFQLSAGYRAISLDYEKGSGQDRFLYNVTTFGGVLRFGFNF